MVDRPDMEHDGKYAWVRYACHLERKELELLSLIEGIKQFLDKSSPARIVALKDKQVKDLGKAIYAINQRRWSGPDVYLIIGHTEIDDLYWSNEDGWGDRDSATQFNSATGYNLPIDGKWLTVRE